MNFIEHVHEPRRLLLVWQGPEGSSRTRHAVAELLRVTDERAQLRYLTGTSEIDRAHQEGFVHFPAFRKLEQTYDVGVVETFMRRLPPRTRGDYAQYLKQFRLRPETRISDFALLAYTGAKLPSDGFSIVDPLEDIDSPCEVLIEVAGFRHTSEVTISEIVVGDRVEFVPEPDNAVDPRAMAVYLRGHKLGYVPRQQTAAIHDRLRSSAVHASVERVNGRAERPLVYLFTRLQVVGSQFHPRLTASS